MEVDEIQTQVSKFQRISSNPNKIATNNNYEDGGSSGVGRLCGWPASRIVRVSRGSGGKDRHSKVLTSKGLRDRRVRLSVTTAIQFYDLQDRLGYDQPSKAVEWLIKAASSSISELPALDPTSFSDHHNYHTKNFTNEDANDAVYMDHSNNNNNTNHNDRNDNVSMSKSSSSTSETSKGSGLSLSRSENRIRARERARELAAKKEKVNINDVSQNATFTDLLTGGITNATVCTPAASAMDYFQMPRFNITPGDNCNQPQHHHHNQHHFSNFLQENSNFTPVVTTTGGGGLGPGFTRGTLQSNLLSILPHHHNHLQRFQPSSMVDGSTSTSFPFAMGSNIGSGAPDHFPATGYDSQRLQPYGGRDGGGRHADHHKEKLKN